MQNNIVKYYYNKKSDGPSEIILIYWFSLINISYYRQC